MEGGWERRFVKPLKGFTLPTMLKKPSHFLVYSWDGKPPTLLQKGSLKPSQGFRKNYKFLVP
jgi:hypothetical protein